MAGALGYGTLESNAWHNDWKEHPFMTMALSAITCCFSLRTSAAARHG
jgi:hypothetical protein